MGRPVLADRGAPPGGGGMVRPDKLVGGRLGPGGCGRAPPGWPPANEVSGGRRSPGVAGPAGAVAGPGVVARWGAVTAGPGVGVAGLGAVVAGLVLGAVPGPLVGGPVLGAGPVLGPGGWLAEEIPSLDMAGSLVTRRGSLGRPGGNRRGGTSGAAPEPEGSAVLLGGVGPDRVVSAGTGGVGATGVVGWATAGGPDEVGAAGTELTVCSPVTSPVEVALCSVREAATAGSGSTSVDGGANPLPGADTDGSVEMTGASADGSVEMTGALDPLPDVPEDWLPERPVGPRRAPARRPAGGPVAGSGSAGDTSRRRPSASARRRARSAWASSMLEEWLFTPIPRT